MPTLEVDAKLYRPDLFGDVPEQPSRGKIADAFAVPPFTVLSARDGWWQDRKRAWIATGIQSEVGRGGGLAFNTTEWVLKKIAEGDIETGGLGSHNNGTSIFDPVLCELAYRWFAPPGGLVLDPFAGGSVRGIVAAMMGRKYHGIDLRAEQVAANYAQARTITPESLDIPIRVSGASLRQMFHPCDADYIRDVCGAACCNGSSSAPAKARGGICVTIHPSEVVHIAGLGGTVVDGFLAPTPAGRCPFNDPDTSLCTVHDAGKPFGCAASPFTLNDNDTLIVRNRYRLLRCYKDDGAVPAYDAHRFALDSIFGAATAARIAAAAAAGDDVIPAALPVGVYDRLKDNDDAKHGDASRRTPPGLAWVAADSAAALAAAPAADFVFTCPPYADLERYSDDPRDLSAMDWPAFAAAYRRIIAAACARLRDDRFAAIVVGDVRDKAGFYRGLPELTVAAFADAGLRKYNEAVLATSVGSLPMRVTSQFDKSRKMGKTHQNVLVFVKGDPRRATAAIGAADAPTQSTLFDVA